MDLIIPFKVGDFAESKSFVVGFRGAWFRSKVVLVEPPIGEGGPPHQVNPKDLRPALDWSIIEGWTVPLSAANGKRWYAARLIHPKSGIEESKTDGDETLENMMPTSTHKSPDPTKRGTHGSRKRQIAPSELVQLQPLDTIKGSTAEPERPSSGTGARRYPLRVRKPVKNALLQQK